MTPSVEERLTDLEHWRAGVLGAQSVATIQQKYLEERFDRIDRRLDRYDSHISKMIWAIVSLFLAAFSVFVLSGGLIPQ
jgi:hypothetical protein